MRIYYTAVDQGDGSMNVEFFDDPNSIRLLEEFIPEYYRGEGGSYFDVDSQPINITIETLESVKETLLLDWADPEEIEAFLARESAW